MSHILPECAFKLEQLKLVTMTVMADIPTYFNLDVVSRYIPLDNTIIGIHYRDIHRGQDDPEANDSEDDIPMVDTDMGAESKSGRFKNQCTFIINDGSKIINTKLFNNGKIVNGGCKDIQQAVFTANLILGRIFNMNGNVSYIIPSKLKYKSMKDLKKLYKDDLRKKFGNLIKLLVTHLNINTNLECFDAKYTADDSFNAFMTMCETDPSFIKDIMYIYTIITVLKCYYKDTLIIDNFGDDSFQKLLNIIIASSDHEKNIISYDFPSYLNNDLPIVFNKDTVNIVLINKSTKCGYYINRKALQSIMTNQPEVSLCKYDKSKYPGVITKYTTSSGKIIKIIVFNTGKINITAANSHEQCEEGYEFIKRICTEHFNDLVMKSEYTNKKKEYEDSLPDQHYMGLVNDQEYYLLYKVRILSNPRNIRFLHKLGLIEKYKDFYKP